MILAVAERPGCEGGQKGSKQPQGQFSLFRQEQDAPGLCGIVKGFRGMHWHMNKAYSWECFFDCTVESWIDCNDNT